MIFTHTPPTPEGYMSILGHAVIDVREAYIAQLESDHPDWVTYRLAREQAHLDEAAAPVLADFERLKREVIDPVDNEGVEVADADLERVFRVAKNLRELKRHAEERGLPAQDFIDKFDFISAWMTESAPETTSTT